MSNFSRFLEDFNESIANETASKNKKRKLKTWEKTSIWICLIFAGVFAGMLITSLVQTNKYLKEVEQIKNFNELYTSSKLAIPFCQKYKSNAPLDKIPEAVSSAAEDFLAELTNVKLLASISQNEIDYINMNETVFYYRTLDNGTRDKYSDSVKNMQSSLISNPSLIGKADVSDFTSHLMKVDLYTYATSENYNFWSSFQSWSKVIMLAPFAIVIIWIIVSYGSWNLSSSGRRGIAPPENS